MKYKSNAKKGTKKVYAAAGMMNADASQKPPQQQAPQQQAPASGGISVTAVLTAEAQGTQQNIGTIKIQSPDDLKKLVQVVMQVFQQGQQQPGGDQQQPAQPEQQPAQ